LTEGMNLVFAILEPQDVQQKMWKKNIASS
jgi:hypothetical protein